MFYFLHCLIILAASFSMLDSNDSSMPHFCSSESDSCEIVPGLVWLFSTVSSKTDIHQFLCSRLPKLDLQPMEYKQGTNRNETANLEYDITPSTFSEHHVWPHNEQAYSLRSPKYIAFRYYAQPEVGAYTILFPNRNITADIDVSIMQRIREHGLMYELFLPHNCEKESMTACWKTFFEVSTLEEISLAQHQSIDNEIFSDGILYRNVVPGIRLSEDGEDIYWNSILTRNQFPFIPDGYHYHVRFGDGTDFTEAEIEHLVNVHYAHGIKIKPNSHSIVLVNNLEFAHGRTNYEGHRKVTASIFSETFRKRSELIGFSSTKSEL